MNIMLNSARSICLLILLVIGLHACDGGGVFNDCNNDYNFYSDHLLHFQIIDKRTGINVLEIGVNRYNSDTVQIYDENLKPVGTGTHPHNDGSIYFIFLVPTRDLDEPLNTPIEHTYYLYFEKKDYDTLRINYQIGLDECNDRILTQWSTSYNDSIYFDRDYNPYRFSEGALFIKEVF